MKYDFSLDLSNCCPYNQLMICLFHRIYLPRYLHIKSPKRKRNISDIKTKFSFWRKISKNKKWTAWRSWLSPPNSYAILPCKERICKEMTGLCTKFIDRIKLAMISFLEGQPPPQLSCGKSLVSTMYVCVFIQQMPSSLQLGVGDVKENKIKIPLLNLPLGYANKERKVTG